MHQPLAIDCSGNQLLAQAQLSLIRSPQFATARRELAIAHHWFLVIPGYPLQMPKQSELLDALYVQVEEAENCAIVVL